MEARRGGTTHHRPVGQRGFTLLELLVTIAILGVLSGVAVFGVSQLTENAEESACSTEARTITVAQEAHRVSTGAYGDLDAIVDAGLLSQRPELHDVQVVPGGWQLVALGVCAGGADELAASREGGGDGTAAGGDVVEERAGADEGAPTDEPAPQRPQRLHRQPVAGPNSCGPGTVDLNRAGAEQLTRIVHVNPGRAIQVERGRPFSSVKELQRVEGFDQRRVDDVLREGLACV